MHQGLLNANTNLMQTTQMLDACWPRVVVISALINALSSLKSLLNTFTYLAYSDTLNCIFCHTLHFILPVEQHHICKYLGILVSCYTLAHQGDSRPVQTFSIIKRNNVKAKGLSVWHQAVEIKSSIKLLKCQANNEF